MFNIFSPQYQSEPHRMAYVGLSAFQRQENLCYISRSPRTITESVICAVLWRRDYGNGRCAMLVCSADWVRRNCHVLLRKRPRSHPL
jgi:hypothetical protein